VRNLLGEQNNNGVLILQIGQHYLWFKRLFIINIQLADV